MMANVTTRLCAPLLVLVALVCASASATAQTAEQRAACSGDFQKLCPGVVPGGGRPFECLSKQKDKLSDACRKVIDSQAQAPGQPPTK